MTSQRHTPVQETSTEAHLRFLIRDHSNYHSWGPENFREFTDQDIRVIRSGIAAKTATVNDYLPRSFATRYGEFANAMFMQALLAESDRRNVEPLMTRGMLNAVYSGEGDQQLPERQIRAIRARPDVPQPYRREDGVTVQATAPEILNLAIAQNAVVNQATRITIPPEAARAFGAANRGLIPPSLINQPTDINITDETAFDSGFMTRAGLSRNVSPVPMAARYNPEQARSIYPQIARDIFDPNKPDVNTRDAWAAGWVAADILYSPGSNPSTTMYGRPVVAQLNPNLAR